jgi:predicted nucleotidyltransferase
MKKLFKNMKQKEFWTEWKQITAQEKKAIDSISKAKQLLLRHIPKEKIVAIYVKGSFVRREMNAESDVDIVPVITDSRYLPTIIKLNKEHKKKEHNKTIYPAELLPHSLWELRNQKRYAKRKEKGPKGKPSIEDFKDHKIIYGTALEVDAFPSRSTQEKFNGMYKAFQEIFIPLYLQEKMSFAQFSKQIFWITKLEQQLQGKEIPETWKELASTIQDAQHPVHDALRFRTNKATPREKELFLKKTKTYLIKIKKLIVREPER